MFLLTVLCWTFFFLGFVHMFFTFMLKDEKSAPPFLKNRKISVAMILGGLFVGMVLKFMPFVSVNSGYVGIVLKFKEAQQEVLQPGLHLYNPFFEDVVEWSTQILKSTDTSDSSTKDIQHVTVKWALNWRLDPKNIVSVYKTVGNDIEARIIDPSMQESLKAISAKYTAEELISQREQMRAEVKTLVSQKLQRYGITVEDFSVMNFSFSKKFTDAIEAKQEAEQLAAKAKNDLDRVRIEAEQKVAQAQAEAEALRAQKQEITPELLELRKVEMQREAIAKWDGRLPQNTGGYVPFLNLGNK